MMLYPKKPSSRWKACKSSMEGEQFWVTGSRKWIRWKERDSGGISIVVKDGLFSAQMVCQTYAPSLRRLRCPGSGKTTLFSLICSDHPQAYSLPIRVFGRSRLPTPSEPGISIFDIQARIGQSSPEIHNFFPRHLTIRQTIESAWADTFLSKPHLTFARDSAVDACLRWFQHELDLSCKDVEPLDDLVHSAYNEYGWDKRRSSKKPKIAKRDENGNDYGNGIEDRNLGNALASLRGDSQHTVDAYLRRDTDWADRQLFGASSFTAQRIALFLRAVVKKPDLLLLDEAFSGLDARARTKCMMFLAFGETRWLMRPRGGKAGSRGPDAAAAAAAFESRLCHRTLLERAGRVAVGALEARQALVCVGHRAEEVPPVVGRWVRLPEPGTGRPVRFGTVVTGRKRREKKAREDWWEEVWGLNAGLDDVEVDGEVDGEVDVDVD